MSIYYPNNDRKKPGAMTIFHIIGNKLMEEIIKVVLKTKF
jgi:hypothetical protein